MSDIIKRWGNDHWTSKYVETRDESYHKTHIQEEILGLALESKAYNNGVLEVKYQRQ